MVRFEGLTSAGGYLAFSLGILYALSLLLLHPSHSLPPTYVPTQLCTLASIATPLCPSSSPTLSCVLPLALTFRHEPRNSPDLSGTYSALLPLTPHEADRCLNVASLQTCADSLGIPSHGPLDCLVAPHPAEEGEEEGKEGKERVSVVLAHFASRMDAFLASPDNGPNRIDAAVAAGAVSWSSYALFLLLISLLCVPCCAIWGILLAYSSLVEHDFAFMKSLTCNAPTPHRSSSSPSSLPLFARNRKPAD